MEFVCLFVQYYSLKKSVIRTCGFLSLIQLSFISILQLSSESALSLSASSRERDVHVFVVLNLFNSSSTLSSAHLAIKINKANIPIKILQNAPPIMPIPTKCTARFTTILPSCSQIIPKKSNMLVLSDFINDPSPISKSIYLQVSKGLSFYFPYFQSKYQNQAQYVFQLNCVDI